MEKNVNIYFMAAIMTMVSSVCMHGITAKANDTLVTEEGEIADELQVGEMEVLSGNVSIDEVHFPDENFRNYVNENFDTDGDGNLSDEEIKI